MRNAFNIRYRLSNVLLLLHLVELEPHDTVKDICKLNFLLYINIKVEPSTVKKTISPCLHCQKSRYLQPSVVRCGQNHGCTQCNNKAKSSRCPLCLKPRTLSGPIGSCKHKSEPNEPNKRSCSGYCNSKTPVIRQNIIPLIGRYHYSQF